MLTKVGTPKSFKKISSAKIIRIKKLYFLISKSESVKNLNNSNQWLNSVYTVSNFELITSYLKPLSWSLFTN